MTVTPSSTRPLPLGDQPLTGGSTAIGSADIPFESLLKGFDNQLNFKDDGQKSIMPVIGQSADSFLEAALPIHTALPLPASRIWQEVAEQISTAIEDVRSLPAVEQAIHILARVAEALHRDPAAGTPTAANAPIAVTIPTSRPGPIAPEQPASSATPIAQIRANMQPERTSGLLASLRLPARTSGTELPAPAAISPFTAHLLDLEGQLRLVVRLPRLLESERQELETRLRQLLEEFGHHGSELVIRDSAGGPSHG